MNVSIDFLKTSFSKAILFATRKFYYLADGKQTKFSRIGKEADSKKDFANKSIVRKKGNTIINLPKTDLERWSAN